MDMIEHSFLRSLEPFRSPAFPFLYILKEPQMIEMCLARITLGSFGIETGFGRQPARVFYIDKTIPWILTECNETQFNIAVRPNKISTSWEGVPLEHIIGIPPIFMVHKASNDFLERKAKTIVYRNPDYNVIDMVPYQDLAPGRRVVVILDLHLIGGKSDIEWPKYYHFLTEYGYDPDQIIERPVSLPPYCNMDMVKQYAKESRQFVLDVTK